ncbi:MAG: futalosine hydrolase [Bacteroides sp.]|nr:MAG: futalosine hydrolase [Bacteroides sp.]
MKILIVAATEKELNNLYKDLNVDFLVTGIGQTFTTYKLTTKLFNHKYDYIYNIGIAGSFNKNIKIGDVVQVTSDRIADLGSENDSSFTNIFDKKLENKDQYPFINGVLYNKNVFTDCKQVSAITVNYAHGNTNTINYIRNQYSVDIESMEGASVFYICLNFKIPFYQIRCISNYVQKRSASKWNIDLAIKNLHQYIIKKIKYDQS